MKEKNHEQATIQARAAIRAARGDDGCGNSCDSRSRCNPGNHQVHAQAEDGGDPREDRRDLQAVLLQHSCSDGAGGGRTGHRSQVGSSHGGASSEARRSSCGSIKSLRLRCRRNGARIWRTFRPHRRRKRGNVLGSPTSCDAQRSHDAAWRGTVTIRDSRHLGCTRNATGQRRAGRHGRARNRTRCGHATADFPGRFVLLRHRDSTRGRRRAG